MKGGAAAVEKFFEIFSFCLIEMPKQNLGKIYIPF